MREDRERIAQLLGDESFTFAPLNGGRFDARVYRVQSGSRVWAVKVFPTKPYLHEWYTLLREIGEPRLVVPCDSRETDPGTTAAMAPWIEGESLSARLAAHPNEAETWGRQAAALLRTLHARPVDETHLPVRYAQVLDRAAASASACALAEGELASLPHAPEYRVRLKQFHTHLQPGKVCLLHKDLHPENFIVCGEELYLIDFENGGLGECEQDFVRLMNTFGTHAPFSQALLRHYWGGEPPELFWERCLGYDALMFPQSGARC